MRGKQSDQRLGLSAMAISVLTWFSLLAALSLGEPVFAESGKGQVPPFTVMPPSIDLSLGGTIGNTIVVPVTKGFHSDSVFTNPLPQRVAVWSLLPTVELGLLSWLQYEGRTVIAHEKLTEAFEKLRFEPAFTSADEPKVREAAALAGAASVIFAYTTVTRAEGSGLPKYNMTVTIREVAADRDDVLWQGEATTGQPGDTPEEGLGLYTELAIARALCPVEHGYTWVESKKGIRGGCEAHARL